MIENRINILQTFGGRLDPQFYNPRFTSLVNKIERFGSLPLYKLAKLSSETWNQKDYFDDVFPYIEISAINIESGNIDDISWVEKINAPSRAKKIVRNNDIIISTTRPNRGAISLVATSDFNIASTGFTVIRDVEKSILRDYLFIVLRQSFCLDQMEQRCSGGNYPAITEDELKKIVIPLPPMEVQRRIVDIYSKASEQKRAKEQEAQALLEGIDSYLLGELGITLPETPHRQLAFKVNISEMLGNMFDCRTYNAKTMALKEMINHYTGHKLKLRELVLHSIAGDWGIDETEVPENKANQYTKCVVIRATEFDNKNNLNLDNSRVKFRMIRNDKLNKMDIRSNDIFIEKSGGSPDQPVGRVAILTSEIEQNNVLCYSNFIHKIRVDASKVLPQYLFYYLRALYNVKVTESMQSQTNGIRNLIMASFLGQYIIIPPIAKQNEIAETISAIRAKASALQTEAAAQIASAKAQIEKIILG